MQLIQITAQMNRKTLSIYLQEKLNKLARNTHIYIFFLKKEK